MVRIDEQLLRKRAEHNEMCLSTLEEVTLHQFEIEKIENLDKLCRNLKILYLQNNIIFKMENLNKLKQLDYLNLALNNIQKIEGIEGCESLRKLDLTVNFIDAENYQESLDNLKKCPSIRELYLTGNPITDWKPQYRELAVAMVDQLKLLDGQEINPTERIQAKQKLDQLLIELEQHKELVKIEKERKELEKQKLNENSQNDVNNVVKIQEEEDDEQNQKDKELKNLIDQNSSQKEEHSIENRTKMYREMAREKEDADRAKNPDKYKEKKISSIYKPESSDLRQCNEGRYAWKLCEWDYPEYSIFEINIPKYLDTSLIDLNLFPFWVSVRIKDKLTQIKLQEEIIVEKSQIQRSQITGVLTIKMAKLNPNEAIRILADQQEKKKKQEFEKQQKIQDQKKLEQQKKKDFFGNDFIPSKTNDQKQQLDNKYSETTSNATSSKIKYNNDDDYDDMPDLE